MLVTKNKNHLREKVKKLKSKNQNKDRYSISDKLRMCNAIYVNDIEDRRSNVR